MRKGLIGRALGTSSASHLALAGLLGAIVFLYTLGAPLVRPAAASLPCVVGTSSPNDAFAGARLITGLPYQDCTDTRGPADEEGEPRPAGAGPTVWYRYDAGTSGLVTVSTCSPTTTLDTVAAVYSGASLASLELVEWSGDLDFGDCLENATASGLYFDGVAGTSYRIQIAGMTGTGFFDLRVCQTSPQNTRNCPVTSSNTLPEEPISAAVLPAADPVVVATFDTGTNPFHPCFRRPGSSPSQVLPGFPADAETLDLTFGSNYGASLAASQTSISSIVDHTLYEIPNTNLTFYGGTAAREELIDYYPHGSQASSQIACNALGVGSNSVLVILNWYLNPGNRAGLMQWAADQDWIDVIHLNIQDFPLPVPIVFTAHDIEYAISTGKVVVIAAGNGVGGGGASYPMELSRWNGPPGSLIAGANDNGGYTYFSNLNPHVVMDGSGTVAAEPYGFGTTGFGGTSSSSPRISGYVARVIGALRQEFGHVGPGLVRIPSGSPRPPIGPLSDGLLTAAELHEVVRKTADPNPHDSYYDGQRSLISFPQPAPLPHAAYVKMGYGEVSEHTIAAAIDVAAGRAPMPVRQEDPFYSASEAQRELLWGSGSIEPLGVK